MTNWDRVEGTNGIWDGSLSSQRLENRNIQKHTARKSTIQKFKIKKKPLFFAGANAPQAPSAAGDKCCSIASNRKMARVQRGSRALTRRAVHIYVRSPGGEKRPLSVYACMCVCVYVCMCVCVYVCMCVCV